jgi:hypothetical protein
MSCTRHFLNFTWEAHSWRRRVVASECVTTYETSMWGVDRREDFVRCDKEQVCTVCGKTRREVTCLCGKEFGEHCPPRCAWIDRVTEATL